MTDEEREQVVELLRCAADWHMGLHETAIQLSTTHRVLNLANRAYEAIPVRVPWFETFLEAALLVEEGRWP